MVQRLSKWAAPAAVTASMALFGAGMGPIGVALLISAGTARAKNIIVEAKRMPVWVLVPMATLMAMALVHLMLHHDKNNTVGMVLALLFPVSYLLGAAYRERVATGMAALGILMSVAMIIQGTLEPITQKPGLMSSYHITGFMIIIGALMSKGRWRWLSWALAVPAIAVSASEEAIAGLAVLAVVAAIWMVKNKMAAQMATAALAVALLVAAMTASGGAAAALDRYFPNINGTRVSLDLEVLTHCRWSGYVQLVTQHDWIEGTGWYWRADGWTATPRDSTSWMYVHNAPLRIASQYGIVAMLAWIGLVVIGTWKAIRRGRLAEIAIWSILIWYSIVDHMMWTWLGLAFWTIIALVPTTSRTSTVPQPQQFQK